MQKNILGILLILSTNSFAAGLRTNHFCQNSVGFNIDEVVITKCFSTSIFENADEICRKDYKTAFPKTSSAYLNSEVTASSYFTMEDCTTTLEDNILLNLDGIDFRTKKSSDGKRTILYYRYPGFSGN